MKDCRATQRGQILNLLITARGGWVELRSILALNIAQYNARILELRRLGFSIVNKKIENLDGRPHSCYRLQRGPVQRTAAKPAAPAEERTPESLPLFPDLGESRYPES